MKLRIDKIQLLSRDYGYEYEFDCDRVEVGEWLGWAADRGSSSFGICYW